MTDSDPDPDSEPVAEEFEGTPVFPPGTSVTHRRRLLAAMAGAGTVAIAGCLDALQREVPADDDEVPPPDPGPSNFVVDLEVPDEVGVNEEYEVVGTVENQGESTALQEVTLTVDGFVVDSAEFMLAEDESATLATTVTSGHPGDSQEIEIESDDDAASRVLAVGAPDYTEITEFMFKDVAPKQLVKELNVKVAFNDERVFFRYWWEQPDPGGWLHDMLYYDGEAGKWRRLSDWDPWVLDEDYGYPERHEGYYEDRLSWFWHDGSLQTPDGERPFEQFGGWMTVMEGVRTLPGEAPQEAIEEHPHFGEEGLGRSDMRKYIPHSRNGEWWEHDWDDVKPAGELEQMMLDGEYLDFPFWRAHRSNPIGYGTNHHVLDYRHGPRGENEDGEVRNTFGSQSWDPDDGPEYMFDPDVVEGGAIDRADVIDEDGNPLDDMPDQQDFESYALIKGENMVEFDPDVAQWDGALIPRRPLQEPYGSGGSWAAEGTWSDGEWVVEMSRELDTGYIDDMPVESGEVYTFSPAIHHGVSQRWHWVAYPLKLAMGEDADVPADWEEWDDAPGSSYLRAHEIDGDEPDWDEVEAFTIPLMYPGMTDWTWLTSGEHPRVGDVRDATINIWEHHDENPENFAERMTELEERFAPRK